MRIRTTVNRPRLGARLARAASLGALALAATLFHPNEARAQWTTSGTNTTTTNNVGVGTTAPTAQFDLRAPSGDVVTRLSNAGGQNGQLDLRYKYESAQHRMGFTDSSGQWMFFTQYAGSSAGSFGFFPGRVVIGTAATPHRLTVDNTVDNGSAANVRLRSLTTRYRSDLLMQGTGGLTINSFDDIAGAALPIRIDASTTILGAHGNVGVNTTAPAVRFAVNGTGTNVYSTDAWIENNMHIQGNEVMQQGGGRGRMRLGTAWGYVGVYAEKTSANVDNDLVLGAGSGVVRVGPGGLIPQSLIVPNGNVGVGTSAPAARLHVAGDIRVDGNINAKYQDVAEWVPSTQKLAAGTVVVLDKSALNHVLASSRAYDTKVAGVISPRPGISLGEAGEGKVLVATTGRVKIKVDATRGPIEVGDLLVTSDVEGVAMKSVPVELGGTEMHRPGTLIGKALEPLAKGTGEILVLLSLQ